MQIHVNEKMASASSKSAKNLFADSKKRLAERISVNINNAGSIARQTHRGAKSNEILNQTVKSMCHTESTMEASRCNLHKMQVILAQLNYQQDNIKKNLEKSTDVQEKIRDMQR